MSSAGRRKTRRAGLPALIVPAMLAALMVAPVLPARADNIISFNPDGTGTGAGVINGVQNFTYSTGNVLDLGGIPLTVGTTSPFFYQSFLTGVSGEGGSLAGASSGGNLTDGTGALSGKEFTAVLGFRNTVTSITPAPGGGSGSSGPGSVGGSADALQIAFAPVGDPAGTGTTAPNFFRIYALPSGSSVNNTGQGFQGTDAQIILSGHVITAGSSSVFKEDGTISGTTFTPHTENFNQSGGTTTVATASTITGTGSTSLNVAVDFANPLYFPNAPLTQLIQLAFSSTNTLAFKGVTPSSGFYDGVGTAPDILYPTNFNPGTINGTSGPDGMFQAVAQNSFLTSVIPEPASIIPALTAAAAIPSFLFLRRWRRSKSPVVA